MTIRASAAPKKKLSRVITGRTYSEQLADSMGPLTETHPTHAVNSPGTAGNAGNP
jgi:hypothetical protein